jgi:hypothetical protein
MVQLVFVHGVSNRSGPAFAQQEKIRNELIRTVLFDGSPLTIASPVWGDLVPPLAWGGAAFPKNGTTVASLSLTGGFGAPSGATADDAVLARMAASDPSAAVDELFASLVAQAEAEGRDLTADELGQFKAAAALLESTDFKPDIAGASNDQEFVDELRKAMGHVGSYGLLDPLKDAAAAVADGARNLVSTGLSKLFRDDLNPLVAQFLGDVFVYLKPGAPRDQIRAKVVGAISTAFAAKAAGEPLVLMAHSLGGVILYDLLSSPTAAGLPPGFRANAFITVGSQPGLFQEMGLFDYKPAGHTPPNPMSGPANVDHWINVFDAIDLFGFRAEPVFGMATDYEFNSMTGLLSSHSTYFRRPQFHARLRKRLKTAGVI